MLRTRYDMVVVGAGIIGLATAMELLIRHPSLCLAVLDKEDTVAAHQTSHNSGVIHSGIYYKPGSLKARLAVEGGQLMLRFCATHNVPHEQCGKVIVALRPDELPALQRLFERGMANNVPGLQLIGPERLREIEPHCVGLRAIYVPSTGITTYAGVARAYAAEIVQRGGEILTGHNVIGLDRRGQVMTLQTDRGEIYTRHLITCAGLYADRVSRLSGATDVPQVVPFRGDYYTLRPEQAHLIKNLIYPVPNPDFPFLGVHFTRHIDGERSLGPNAVPAFARQGYGKLDINLGDNLETLRYPGFWRMARTYWKTGLAEMWRDVHKASFVRALQAYIPEIQAVDCLPGHSGVRAQALGLSGTLIDDFSIVAEPRIVHVLNAPSPAATASLAICRIIVEAAERAFELPSASTEAV